jgi:hypothetical protein
MRRSGRWKAHRLQSRTVRLFTEVATGRVALAVRSSEYADLVKEGGERTPDDSPVGVRWLAVERPIEVHAADVAVVPIHLEPIPLEAASRAFDSRVLVPVNEVFALSVHFGLSISARAFGNREYFVAEMASRTPGEPQHTIRRFPHSVSRVAARADNSRFYIYFETDVVGAEHEAGPALKWAERLYDQGDELRRLWRSRAKSPPFRTPKVAALIESLRATSDSVQAQQAKRPAARRR